MPVACKRQDTGKSPLYHREEQLQQFTSLGLEAVLADFNDKASLQVAMQGCKKLFLLTSPDEQHTQRESAIIDTAVEASICHIVRTSTADANLSSKLSYARSPMPRLSLPEKPTG